ncbi:MAG: hypothetical protein QM541_10890 [Flavobacterium sp.]|nr:hypothetical protein [Flavobacterium sp.]
MITKGNRQQGTPYFISQDKSMKLERVPLTEKLFQEQWLQKLIHNNPQVLPIDDIESGFAPLISLGREMSTSVGYIDNLYISPNGYLTVVETKLWRNPEAKREVVGQIIDYAKELTTWTYSKLNDAVKVSSQLLNNNTKGVIELIKEFDLIDESQEQIIIDNIDRNFKRGRLLLLIVGDGIRESVEDMVEYLSNTPQVQFTLGLVELQVYKNPNIENDLIVIPNLITRTKEITRAIIKIENSTTNNVINVETDFKEEKSKSQATRNTISEDDFFEQLKQNTDNESCEFAKYILKNSIEKGYYIEWNSGSFVTKLLDPNGSGQKVTLFVTDRKGLFYIGWTLIQLSRLGLSKEPSIEFAKQTASLVKGLKPNPNHLDSWNKYSTIKEIKPVFTEFMNEVDKFVERINEELKTQTTE